MTNAYIEMQKNFYTPLANQWGPEFPNRNHVVGWFEEHNAWPGYEHLFAGLNTKEMIALDFGCGPGRGIVKYWNRFKRIDGVDLMERNIENARTWVRYNNYDDSLINLYTCNGTDLQNIPNEQYDMIFSMICMQHICVHEIRFHYLEEFYRILKPSGLIAIQMGYGNRGRGKVHNYYENFYNAITTNGDEEGAGDVAIETPQQLSDDLEKIGFSNFWYVIDVPFLGEKDTHPQWIYFRASK